MIRQAFENDFRTALQHHRAGRTAASEPLYRRILAADPDHAEASRLLGSILGQSGRVGRAGEFQADLYI